MRSGRIGGDRIKLGVTAARPKGRSLSVCQLKSYPSEVSPVARNDPTRHVERRAAESKLLTQGVDNYFLGLLLGMRSK